MPPQESQTLPLGGADPLPLRSATATGRERHRSALTEARDRTLRLVQPVAEEDLNRVHDPLQSPLVWDLGHIAAFEELWLCRRVGGLEPLRPDLARVYDAAETPRPKRERTPYLRRDDALEFMEAVRRRSLEVLERAAASPDGDELGANGFVWEMVVQHEHQHNETMLQTLQLARPGVFSPIPRAPAGGSVDGSWPTAGGAASRFAGGDEVRLPAATCKLGDPGIGFAYDNERPCHECDLPSYTIDRAPVTNGAYARFIEAGGYRERELWTSEGWEWREAERAERPLYWTGDWRERRFDRIEPIDPALPVMHVSWYEADAYARWAGKRLPTEAEWERAAAWDEATGRARRYPWGDEPPTSDRANLDQLAFGPASAGSLAGSTPTGVASLLGDCWEWTASPFRGYPGFRAFPYREYSEVFFGSRFRVLRGGSWATRRSIARNTFRNWDLPQRRHIFAGFRCASDVEG